MNPGLAFGHAGPHAGGLAMGGRRALAWSRSWRCSASPCGWLPTGGALSALALGLILGGAVGNLIDRARFGAVVDFLDFFWRDYHWPAFNVADSGITVGVTLLAFRMVFPTRESDAA